MPGYRARRRETCVVRIARGLPLLLGSDADAYAENRGCRLNETRSYRTRLGTLFERGNGRVREASGFGDRISAHDNYSAGGQP